jgi:hypothetical protein
MVSSAEASVAVVSGPVTGNASVAGGTSEGAGACVVAGAQAASTKLIATSVTMNERTNVDIDFLLLVFFTCSSYQVGFKDMGRIG